MARPPVPPMLPEKVLAAWVSVSVWLPNATLPAPDRVWIDAPALVPDRSNVPASATPEELAIDPLPASASVVPAPMVVAPE